MGFMGFWCACVKHAKVGGSEFANNWTWLIGVPVVAGLATGISGRENVTVTGYAIADGMLAAVGAFLITWGLYFLYRFVHSPVELFNEQKIRADGLQAAREPNLRLHFNPMDQGFLHQTPTAIGRVLMIRVLPTCNADIPHCRGQLLMVWKWVKSQWIRTQMDEAFDLKWSLQHKDDIRELTLRPEVRQFLDVAVVADQRKHIEPAIFIRSNRAIATFAEGQPHTGST